MRLLGRVYTVDLGLRWYLDCGLSSNKSRSVKVVSNKNTALTGVDTKTWDGAQQYSIPVFVCYTSMVTLAHVMIGMHIVRNIFVLLNFHMY